MNFAISRASRWLIPGTLRAMIRSSLSGVG